MRKLITIALITLMMTSCTGIGGGLGIPIGPVNLGIGTTINIPKKKSKSKTSQIKNVESEMNEKKNSNFKD